MSCFAVLLISLCFVTLTVSAVADPPVNYDALTWLQWRDLYDTSAASMTLERLYKSSPRVRVKMLVATQISMDQLLAGEAILRQQLSDIAGVSVARVQLETLQTSALRASDRGEYVAAIGISALPDPMASDLLLSGSQDMSLDLAAAIDLERERIIERVRYGALVRGQNVTIASIALFGSAMELRAVDLDGESFYAIDLTPWIAARIAVVPAVYSPGSSVVSGSTSSTSGITPATISQTSTTEYQPSRDVFQNLRLRFLLAKALLPLRLSVSDILVRASSTATFSAYHSLSASVVEVEVHVADESFRSAVDGYLRNGSLPHAFSTVEPQWVIAAIDLDPRSGILYSPPAANNASDPDSAAPVSSTTSALNMAFELRNVPFIQLASRRWRILERVAQWLALNGCYGCQVRFKGVEVDSSAATDSKRMSHSDEENETALDPINAPSMMLSVHVDTPSPELSSVLLENLQHQMTSGSEAALCISTGVHESDDEELTATAGVPSATCALIWYQNAASVSPTTVSPEPFVQLNLTLTLSESALNASMTTWQIAESVFDHFRIRSALLMVLQQVAVYDEQVQLAATSVLPIDEIAEPLLMLTYKVVIADESQRKGIKAVFLSRRFEYTLGTYTQQRLRIADRVVDLHADGSPVLLDTKLPGIRLSLENRAVDTRPVSDSASSATTSVYKFQDPLADANPSVLQFPDTVSAPTCSSAVDSSPHECISIEFASEFNSDALFVRAIESNVALSSPSLVLPPPASSQSGTAGAFTTATMNIPAPKIAYTVTTAAAGASYPWIFYANTSALQSAVASGLNATLAVVILVRFFLETPAAALGTEDSKTFRLDVRVEISTDGGGRRVSVHKSSFLPLVAISGDADGHLEGASAAFGLLYLDPFVSARVQVDTLPTINSSGHSAVTFRIYQSNLGGFFNRASIAASDQTSSPTACTACYATLQACDALLECRALSACFSAAINSDPALYASLFLASTSTSPASHDLSWLLPQCLSGHSEDTKWTLTTLTQFLESLLCVIDAQCPVETTVLAVGLTKELMVRHTPMEQTLAFPQTNFTATLQFLVDLDAAGGERSQVFTGLTGDDASLVALQEMLMELYCGQQSSSITTNFPFVRVSRGADDAVVHIQYFFLSTWTSSFTNRSSSSSLLPYVQALSGDSPVVQTTVDTERLELVVLGT